MSDEDLIPVERLARFTQEHKHGDHVTGSAAIAALDLVLYLGSDEADEIDRMVRRRLEVPTIDDVTSADALAGLELVRKERDHLDLRERRFIEAYMDRGGTWPAGAEALGYPSGGALRARYRRLGGTRTWSAGRPPVETENDGGSFFASREQVAQWWAETRDRLAAHPEIVATPERDTPGYWVLRTPQGEDLGEEITRMLTELRERGVRLTRPDGSELRGERDWSHENARARQWEKEQD